MILAGSNTHPGTQLVLTVPAAAAASVAAWEDQVAAALERAAIACLIVEANGIGDAEATALIAGLGAVVQKRGVALLVGWRPDLVLPSGADGCDLRDATAYHATRKLLGAETSIGLHVPLERHAGMDAAEEGADYIGFDLSPERIDEAIELLTWWGEMMIVPAMAFGSFDAATAKRLAGTGVDFIAPSPALWQAATPLDAIAALGDAIAG